MKKALCIILTTIIALSSFCLTGYASELTPAASANDGSFETDSGVQVSIAPYLYKTTLYQMEFPSREAYSITEYSISGDYTIPHEINDLTYTFVFPAGTSQIECLLSINGETGWRGFNITSEDDPYYWEKDENGIADLTKPVAFNRNETLAERDEYGVLYREYLMDNGSEGFRDVDKLYWKINFVCEGKAYSDSFDIKLYDYDKAEKSSLKAVNFNVAGLPFGIINGTDVNANQKSAAEYLSQGDFDIAAVQEDFGYHSNLVNNLDGFNFMTNHSGTIPGGDGLNIFTKDIPLYNETRVAWNESSGILTDGADELTPKGFVYTVIDLGDGIYIDFYNIHADAFGGDGSVAARTSQYRQLADFINARSAENDRPVIVTGDFNNHIHTHEDEGALYNILYLECGLKDAWMEYHNDGDYFNLYKWHISGLPAWGNWDSVERFMYRAGGGVDILVSDFRYTVVKNSEGELISDHNSAECDFTLIKTADFIENTQELEAAPFEEVNPFYILRWIIRDFFLILSDLINLPVMLEDLFA